MGRQRGRGRGGVIAHQDGKTIVRNGNPIPHLYGASELGSAFAFVYQGGGNLTECLVYDRVAGENAAKEKVVD